jgi:hypothetical protein
LSQKNINPDISSPSFAERRMEGWRTITQSRVLPKNWECYGQEFFPWLITRSVFSVETASQFETPSIPAGWENTLGRWDPMDHISWYQSLQLPVVYCPVREGGSRWHGLDKRNLTTDLTDYLKSSPVSTLSKRVDSSRLQELLILSEWCRNWFKRRNVNLCLVLTRLTSPTGTIGHSSKVSSHPRVQDKLFVVNYHQNSTVSVSLLDVEVMHHRRSPTEIDESLFHEYLEIVLVSRIAAAWKSVFALRTARAAIGRLCPGKKHSGQIPSLLACNTVLTVCLAIDFLGNSQEAIVLDGLNLHLWWIMSWNGYLIHTRNMTLWQITDPRHFAINLSLAKLTECPT